MLIFGREPVKVLAFLSAGITLLSVLVTHWSDEQQAAVNGVIAVVIGLVGAWMVSAEKALPFITGLVQAVLTCALAFGAHIDANTNATIMSFVAALMGMWLRTQVLAPVGPAGERQ